MLRSTQDRSHLAVALLLIGAAAGIPVLALAFLSGDTRGWVSLLVALPLFIAGVLTAMKDARLLTFVLMAAVAFPLFVVAVVAHNLVYGLTDVEEPVFFLIAVLGAPALLVAGLAGIVRLAACDLWARFQLWRAQGPGGTGSAAPRAP